MRAKIYAIWTMCLSVVSAGKIFAQEAPQLPVQQPAQETTQPAGTISNAGTNDKSGAGNTPTNDTIRLGAVTEHGNVYPMILLDEVVATAKSLNPEERKRKNKLRNDIYTAYPYAITAATILRDIYSDLDKLDGRRDRKQYLKSVDKRLDNTFKEPLKNLTIDQGHVLIKLINRQTGQNCYSIIKELKGGFAAFIWQGVGVVFSNNLKHEYDPEDRDKEVEGMVRELEASNAYRYQLYQQQELLKKIAVH